MLAHIEGYLNGGLTRPKIIPPLMLESRSWGAGIVHHLYVDRAPYQKGRVPRRETGLAKRGKGVVWQGGRTGLPRCLPRKTTVSIEHATCLIALIW
jgi:hypothetical protein